MNLKHLRDREALLATPTTHLQQGGHALESLWICFFGVNEPDQQKTNPLPKVSQESLIYIRPFLGSIATMKTRPLLPGNEHFRNQEEEGAILQGWVPDSTFQ